MKLPKFMLKFSGDCYLHNKPLFVTYKPQHHKVKGHEVRQVLDVMLPGDILLRRHDGYLNTIFTPGFYGHAAIAIDPITVIHAIGEGVIKEDILDFCRCDSIALLRMLDTTSDKISSAIRIAIYQETIRTAYDYEFQSDNGTVYCTELVNVCYDDLFRDDYETVAGNNVLIPDGIYNSVNVAKLLEFKH